MDTVEWEAYPATWLVAKRFGDFQWDTGGVYDDEGIYVICSDEITDYKDAGYKITQFDACAVAVWEE